LQFIALIKLGKAMQAADGRLDDEELNVMSAVVISFGVSPSDYAEMLVLSDEIDATTALGIIAGMNASQKRYVCAFLATIMVADGDIDPKEHNGVFMTCT
jgi:tellurite resistance protein